MHFKFNMKKNNYQKIFGKILNIFNNKISNLI